jgi:hypothetical protein
MTLRWIFLFFLLLLALSPLGCAGLTQDISQEIKQDKLEARQEMEQREKAYEKREYFGLTSKDSDKWNSTDWSLWMDTHGGR